MIVIAILAFVYGVMVIEQRINLKKVKAMIKKRYGQKPVDKDYNFKNLAYHWREYSKKIPIHEVIDDITWNDLEMNKVFSRINNCCSFVGEQILYSKLHYLPQDHSYREILERKVSFFMANTTERETIQVLLSQLGKDHKDYYLPQFMANLDDYRTSGLWRYRYMKFMHLLLIVLVALTIIFQDSIVLFLAVGVFAINLTLYAIGKHKFEVHLDMIKSINTIISVGNSIMNNKDISYEQRFPALAQAIHPFKKMWHLMSIIQLRKEAVFSGDIIALIYDYLIGATLWDFVKYDQLITQLKSNRTEFLALYDILGEIDTSIAIASFRESLPLYCQPIIHKRQSVSMEQIYHPLIEDPVCNTVRLDNACIITGSNASGKSTYIKAVALNVILGQNINTCMAKEMIIPNAKVVTSMAVRDDLMAGESYYIKEIKYLKRIIKNLSQERAIICIIDEILRGTNTEERIAASASILKYLYNKNCFPMVASHDIELTQALDDLYDNYYFTEQMQRKDVIFDYKIYSGVSRSKNAIRLLSSIGFPEEIVQEAKRNVLVGTYSK
jgi:hypothetical protein